MYCPEKRESSSPDNNYLLHYPVSALGPVAGDSKSRRQTMCGRRHRSASQRRDMTRCKVPDLQTAAAQRQGRPASCHGSELGVAGGFYWGFGTCDDLQ